MTLRVHLIATEIAAAVMVCACCQLPSSSGPQPMATGPAPRVVVATAWRNCGLHDGELDETLKASIDSELPAILAALRKTTGAEPLLLPGAKASDLKATVETKAPVPVVLTFIGHGILRSEKEGGGSRLCMDDGPLDVDAALAFLNPHTPHAVLILDACSSANVDVRASPVPVSVVSASSDSVKAWRSGWTAFGEFLAQALEHADRNHDGVTTDRELLRALAELSGTPVSGRLRPSLRRQSWVDLTIGTPLTADWHPASVSMKELLDQVEHAGSILVQRELDVREGRAGEVARRPATLWYLDPELPDHVRWPEESAATRDRRLAEALANGSMAPRVLHVVPVQDYLHIYELPGDEFVGRFHLSEMAAGVANVEAGRAAWKATEGGKTVYHPGWAEKGDLVTVEGERLASDRLVVWPCSSETNTRQCFALTDAAPGGVK